MLQVLLHKVDSRHLRNLPLANRLRRLAADIVLTAFSRSLSWLRDSGLCYYFVGKRWWEMLILEVNVDGPALSDVEDGVSDAGPRAWLRSQSACQRRQRGWGQIQIGHTDGTSSVFSLLDWLKSGRLRLQDYVWRWVRMEHFDRKGRLQQGSQGVGGFDVANFLLFRDWIVGRVVVSGTWNSTRCLLSDNFLGQILFRVRFSFWWRVFGEAGGIFDFRKHVTRKVLVLWGDVILSSLVITRTKFRRGSRTTTWCYYLAEWILRWLRVAWMVVWMMTQLGMASNMRLSSSLRGVLVERERLNWVDFGEAALVAHTVWWIVFAYSRVKCRWPFVVAGAWTLLMSLCHINKSRQIRPKRRIFFNFNWLSSRHCCLLRYRAIEDIFGLRCWTCLFSTRECVHLWFRICHLSCLGFHSGLWRLLRCLGIEKTVLLLD